MSKNTVTIWGRDFDLDVIYESYPGEEVLDSQKDAFEQLNNAELIDTALAAVKGYVEKTATAQIDSPIENIFKYVMPKKVFVPHTTKAPKVAIMCSYKFDMEHGIAVVFENGKFSEVGEQDIIL